MRVKIDGQQYIGGARRAAGTTMLQSIDAASGEPLPYRFHEATAAEVDAAALAAAAAYPVYRNLPAVRRAEFLEAAAAAIDGLGDDFITLVTRETALPAARIQGERGRTSGQLRLFAQLLRRGDFYDARIERAQPQRQPLAKPDLRQYRIGLGPVAVFGASNFPLAFSTAGGDTASALAAGCPVVFKAHPGHMATAACIAEAIVQAARETGMPEGVFNQIYGDRVGAALVQHPAIRAVGFTGSLGGGRALMDMAAARPQPIPVFAEMSSVNPVLLLPAALAARGETIARELAASVSLGGGQFCTKPGLVIGLRSAAFDAFAAELAASMAALPEVSLLNARTLQLYTQGVAQLGAQASVQRLAGGDSAPDKARAQLFKVDGEQLLSNPALQHEVFGPATLLVEAADQNQLVRLLAGLDGQLTVTLIAEPDDLARCAELQPQLEQLAGRLLVNGYPTGVEVSGAMVHGGPYPATSDVRGTSVGSAAIERFLRPVCYQNYPDALLPAPLKNANPLGIRRQLDGQFSDAAITE
ncbi:MAG: aldehyde dehydrogenase (NADP(+)) [Dyella sp.]